MHQIHPPPPDMWFPPPQNTESRIHTGPPTFMNLVLNWPKMIMLTVHAPDAKFFKSLLGLKSTEYFIFFTEVTGSIDMQLSQSWTRASLADPWKISYVRYLIFSNIL